MPEIGPYRTLANNNDPDDPDSTFYAEDVEILRTDIGKLNDLIKGLEYDPNTSAGLTYGFKAGQVQKTDGSVASVAAGTVALTDNATNYVEYNGTAVIAATTRTLANLLLASVVTSGGGFGAGNVTDNRFKFLMPKQSIATVVEDPMWWLFRR